MRGIRSPRQRLDPAAVEVAEADHRVDAAPAPPSRRGPAEVACRRGPGRACKLGVPPGVGSRPSVSTARRPLVYKYADDRPAAHLADGAPRGHHAGPRSTPACATRSSAPSSRPGRQLSENELAALLGVSRTPIREALQRLRDERLVEIVPQLGTFVTRISTRAVADAQFVREALECAAIRAAAGRVTDEDLEALEPNLAAQERAREAADFDAFYVLDDELHHALCDLSGHEIVVAHPAREGPPQPHPAAQPARARLPRRDDRRAPRVVVAARPARPRRRRGALRHHLRMVLCELPRIREQHPDYFEEDDGRHPGPDDHRHRSTRFEQMVADPRLRDRGRAPVQGRPDRRLLPPVVRPGGDDGRRRRTACSATTCSSPATAATASRSRAASRPRP